MKVKLMFLGELEGSLQAVGNLSIPPRKSLNHKKNQGKEKKGSKELQSRQKKQLTKWQ